MEVDGKVIHFYIFKAKQHPFEEASVHMLDTTDNLVTNAQPLCASDVLCK